MEKHPERAGPVGITHPDRVVFPDSGLTKGQLAAYYEAAAPAMLRDLAGRPMALLRFPDGIAHKGFFQKHKGEGWPDGLRVGHDADGEDFMYVTSAEGILGAVQMGAVEFHIRGTRRDRPGFPDRMVLDLDPDPAVPFAEVRMAAQDIGGLLDAAGLPSLPMVSGGKGVHVVVTLRRTAPQQAVEGFARAVALHLGTSQPTRFVATMSRARREGRIFVDWMRNQRGATAIAPFSVRGRPGARVAVPLGWDELATVASADQFGIEAAAARIGTRPEPRPAALTRAVADALARLAAAGRF
ncbi:MAG: non-homologous end-joining DNA ligase [Pseudomonadota bacterium]